jgi:ubiquinone/menaquinone biosynthesis C-methylase UbiE
MTGTDGELERLHHVYEERSQSERRRRLYNPDEISVQFERRMFREELDRVFAGQSLSKITILDVGCSSGTGLGLLQTWEAQPDRFTGIDLMEDRVVQARKRYPSADFRQGSAHDLPFEDAAFDMVVQMTLMSSVLHQSVRAAIAHEMDRVLRPGGSVLWFDFWVSHPRNKDARGIRLREVRRLFPGYSIAARQITLAPPLARALAPVSIPAAELLYRVRPLRTHHLAVLRKPE